MAEAIPRVPTATYRLQFRDGMNFDRAIALIPYWKALGISHLYASPIFSAVSGSTHGYDVTDPNEIDPTLGGTAGFLRLSDALRSAGLGLILDIVPNHMAASLENPYWRHVLKYGRESRYASFFDNHWEQALTLPVLSETLEEAIASGNGKLAWIQETGEAVFDYHGSHYPISPTTYPLAFGPDQGKRLAAADAARPVMAVAPEGSQNAALVSRPADILSLLDGQVWRMIHWREAAKGLSYRRFFEITGLVGVRVEDPDVFGATHRLIIDLVTGGRVQGLRIDHIDGLADPNGYLSRLREAIGPDTYLVVEKILEGDEQTPGEWPIAGTTGYEFIADLAGLLSGESPELDSAWQQVAPVFGAPEGELQRAKRLMVDVNFDGEVRALIRRATSLADVESRIDLPAEMIAEAVRVLVAGFEVYRTYGTADDLDARDAALLEAMFDRLKAASSHLEPALGFLEDLLFTRVAEAARSAAVAFRTRLQHVTGPVLAKSLEDTFFYRYNRMIALNEVGGDPIHGGRGIAHFHRRMQIRRAVQPHALSATSTHDTKRSEDARARLYTISEAPDQWISLATSWRRQFAAFVQAMPGGSAPEPAVEWLIFQSLAGMLPPDFDPTDALARQQILDRFLPYIEKALREAKLRSNWADVNEAYEKAVKAYAAAAIGSPEFMTGFWTDIQPFVKAGLVNSLSQTLIKLTAPGLPDIYQGTEGFDASLVDPDNRRMPDYVRLASKMDLQTPDDFEATKIGLVRRVLGVRKRHAQLFAFGSYTPLETIGRRADNVVAFQRRHADTSVITVVPRLIYEAVATDALLKVEFWGDTAIRLPADIGTIEDVIVREPTTQVSGTLRVADLFRERCFALLITTT